MLFFGHSSRVVRLGQARRIICSPYNYLGLLQHIPPREQDERVANDFRSRSDLILRVLNPTRTSRALLCYSGFHYQ